MKMSDFGVVDFHDVLMVV